MEITNVSTVPHPVAGLGVGYALAASDGVVRCVIPNGTVIPAGGSFLCVNSVAYSLASHPAGNGTTATGDATYTTDIPDNVGIALFSSSLPGDFALGYRIDAVGSTSETNPLYKEGTGYTALTPFSIDYSFYRNLTTAVIHNTEITNPTPGVPQDTDNNAADFVFVDTNGTSAGAGQRLGAPGPANLSSPVPHGGLEVSLLDPCVGEDTPPNTIRDHTSDPANNSTFGTVSFRRTITNTTALPVTRLRLRVADIRTFPAPSGIADMRPRTSVASVVTVDRAPCGTGTSNVTVQGTTLEQPPSQVNGGGFNSTFGVGTVDLGTPLAPGASVDVNVLTGIQQPGSAAVRIIAEALGGGSPTPVTPVCLGTATLSGTNMCHPPAPVVTEHPTDDTVTVGETATFTAAATGFETVRWESSTDEGETWVPVGDATSTTLSFTATRAQDGTLYRAVFVNADEAETPTNTATLTVEARETTVTVAVAPSDPVWGDAVTLTATVSPSSATGTVQFSVDGTDVGAPVAVVDGQAVSAPVEGTATGTREAKAVYSGDDDHEGSEGTAAFSVAARTTTTDVTVDPSDPVWGDAVTLMATVNPSSATGTVQFAVDGTDVGDPVPVVGGVAVSAPVTDLAVGERTVTAVYSGDDDHLTSEDDTTVTVVTDDTAFVRRAYQVVLGRAADSGGLTYWTGVLGDGGNRERVTDGIALSIEGRQRLVADAYVAVLGRPADPAGRDYWVGSLGRGFTAEDLVASMAASAEAGHRSGGTPEGRAGLLYQVHLGRAGDEAGVTYWSGRLAAAGTESARATVARAFGRSDEATAVAIRRAVSAACGAGFPVPGDSDLAAAHAATGRDLLRLTGVVLARHCASAPVT